MNVPCIIVFLIFGFKGVVCNDCGSLNYSRPAFKGRNVTIIFKPIEFSATEEPNFFYSYSKKWQPVTSPILFNPKLGVYTTVFDTNIPNAGLYAMYGGCASQHMPLKLQVPPGQPILQSEKIVQECPECLVGILNKNILNYMFCKTSEGTRPSIILGDEEIEVRTDANSKDIYRISRIIRKGDHMKTVTCSVFKAAIGPLTTSAKLYVAFKLKKPEHNVSILREGSPANVTCVSRTARPATNLSLWLDGEYPLSEDQIKTYDNSTRTYTTTITPNKQARKDWNGKIVSCSASSSLFEEEKTRRKPINCTYPPSTLTMDELRLPSHLQDIYTLEFSCFMDNYNDFCLISWTKDGLPYANGDGTDRIHKSSVIVFANVSKENNGQTITCSVKCSNFEVKLYKSHVVQIPYRPSVHLSVKDELILNARGTTKVTCTAKSLPLSDIVWSIKGDTQIHVCNKSQECEIDINPGNLNEHRNYTCTAYFKFGKYGTNATSSFIAVWRGEESSLTNSTGISIEWIVVGLVGLLAVVSILTAIVLVLARKLFLKEDTHGHPNEHQPVQYANVQENEPVELNDDPTYDKIDKTRRTRPETEECKAKGTNSEHVYADLDIEHLETARKLTSRQRETTPTVYDDVHFLRTKCGSKK